MEIKQVKLDGLKDLSSVQIDNFIKNSKNNKVLGELYECDEYVNAEHINWFKISHVIMNVNLIDDDYYGDIIILNTHHGKKFMDYFSNGRMVYELRQYTRQYQNIQEQKTVIKNQLHSLENSMYNNKTDAKQLNKIIKLFEKQLNESKSIEEI